MSILDKLIPPGTIIAWEGGDPIPSGWSKTSMNSTILIGTDQAGSDVRAYRLQPSREIKSESMVDGKAGAIPHLRYVWFLQKN